MTELQTLSPIINLGAQAAPSAGASDAGRNDKTERFEIERHDDAAAQRTENNPGRARSEEARADAGAEKDNNGTAEREDSDHRDNTQNGTENALSQIRRIFLEQAEATGEEIPDIEELDIDDPLLESFPELKGLLQSFNRLSGLEDSQPTDGNGAEGSGEFFDAPTGETTELPADALGTDPAEVAGAPLGDNDGTNDDAATSALDGTSPLPTTEASDADLSQSQLEAAQQAAGQLEQAENANPNINASARAAEATQQAASAQADRSAPQETRPQERPAAQASDAAREAVQNSGDHRSDNASQSDSRGTGDDGAPRGGTFAQHQRPRPIAGQNSGAERPFTLAAEANGNPPELRLASATPSAEPQQLLTPERLSGWPASQSSLISEGLSAPAGDKAFVVDKGLFGGRPSPAQSAQALKDMQVAISRNVSEGQTDFTLKLNPVEMGRVTVRLQFINGEAAVRAQVLVQNPETLDAIQRDRGGLERALEAGGHKLGTGDLEFGLEKDDQQSAGRALAEAAQQEKMRDKLAAQGGAHAQGADADGEFGEEETVLLDDILPYITPETGLDIRV